MLFCPKCKSLLRPGVKDSKRVMSCSCGFQTADLSKAKVSEKVNTGEPKIEVITKEEDPNPLTEAECPKCGHNKAHYWLIQTRAADEAETKFYKCEKCKHQWRDYT